MNLEDHAGDVIRKARMMSGVSSDAAARAAGLSEADLAQLEESGRLTKSVNFSALGSLAALDAGKLERLAKGWLPSAKDLSAWRELRQISTTEGGNTVHCYLVWDEVTREAALFDTGWDPAPVLKLVETEQLQLKHL